ncbi:cytochrome C oxidase subunit III [Marivirga harenae]|uniref:cytochrome c oxidase subunit 3 n=1 Tax=Marivirga harenae TaxID=2010992 RepID=UPI0026DED414|nr:cytochrome C oxidase subunit III [Marivirga harenae]WKV13252.1 cytochrome C oxidase subunit III [Marivirga harenae]|tara:strand:- start:54472 stop:55089 length:618 start_codon:yes stop_codon:yes gene_type:complete
MDKKTKDEELSFFERVERMHPYKMIFILSLLGSSLIFLFLLFSFFMSLGNEGQKDIEIPAVFALSTVLIGASSFMIHPIHNLFKAEEISSLLTALRFTFFLGLGFALCQILGWKALRESEVLFSSQVSASFLYVLTGLHALHFLAAHTYLGFLIFQTQNISKDPVKYLIAETNPFWHLKYKLITKAWHFLGILWGILVLSFWIFL